ncbi:ATP-dependent RNA helicase Drs1p [Trichomonascus vanleenenianus]|uniref:putative ATP-dependent RNA helicase n=1 Tax=Trichomonascus vanleenenianus TaxID=2268995 RepID=UPI003ECB6834
MAKSKGSKAATKPAENAGFSKKKDDFILTISDDEEGIPDMDSEEEEEEEEEEEVEEAPKSKKKAKKEKHKIKEADLNPDFQFNIDGFEMATVFDGWDFDASRDGSKGVDTRKDVDLDAIIKRKGGLKEPEDESDQEDEDDLAMDGFGMGAAENNQDDDGEDGQDEENNEEDEGEEEEEEEGEEEEEEQQELKAEEGEGEGEEDTAEEIAKYYAPAEEAEKAKEKVHKTFQTLSLSRPILKGLGALGYNEPTKIQGAVIPQAMAGRDLVAGAVTGSGKTAAYLIPVLERLLYRPKNVSSTRVVVMAPTRELAVQVAEVGRKIGQFCGGIRFGLAVGGLNLRQQEQELKTRPDVVIATPGRFIDHVRNSPSFQVDSVEVLILDEADRMLEEGFQKELAEILTLIPSKRQTMLFSATMNSKIQDLIQLSMRRPLRIMVNSHNQAAEGLVQEFIRIRKRDHLKPAVLAHLLKKFDRNQRVIVFVGRKEMAHRLRIILGLLDLKIGELHGSLSQEQRLKSIAAFRNLEVPVLICTDLAARGIDIQKIEYVINYDMPKEHAIYVHRVGRTARAGRQGIAISLVGEAASDRNVVKAVMKSTGANDKIVGRNIDWSKVEKINSSIETSEETVKEILAEEKTEKMMLQAERDLKKTENMIKHEDEIKSRPKRTWFEAEKDKKSESQLKREKQTTKKKMKVDRERKSMEGVARYHKTRADREESKKRGGSKKSDKKANQKAQRAKAGKK